MACCGKKAASAARVLRSSPWTSAKKPAKAVSSSGRAQPPKAVGTRVPVHKEPGSK